MSDFWDLLEFLSRAKEIELKQKEIETQESAARQAAVNGQQTIQIFLESIASNSKQTLEVIKLTRILTWLTVALVVIGLIQIAIMKAIL